MRLETNYDTKVFNLPRGSGKTMRMLYASEFQHAPILCKDRGHKNYLLQKAKRFGIFIPEPICVNELDDKERLRKDNISNILVDEVLLVLNELVKNKRRGLHIVGCTLSDEENENKCRYFFDNGYEDKILER